MTDRNKPRSERIRAKRESKGTRSSARKAHVSQGDSRNAPPVLMRGGMANIVRPKQKKKSRAPKRRFDIELSSPGVEIRLPAVPTVSLGWRLLSGTLLVGLLIVFYHFWTSPLYQVQAAELEGNHYLDAEIANRVINLYNKPIFMVSPQQIETDLQRAFPSLMVESSVQIILPATVIISVQEREPIIAWMQDDETLWIDAEGVSFEPVSENDTLIKVSASAAPPKPIVVVEEQEEIEEVDALDEILTPEAFMRTVMVDAIKTMKEYLPSKAFLTYDPQHGLGWHDEKRDWDVYFGMDISNIEEKLTIYKSIKAQLKEDGVSPVLISIEHIHAPYYRLEP